MHLYFNVFYTGSTRGCWTVLWRHDLVYRVRHSKTPAWSACFRLLTWNPPRPMICSPWVGSGGPSVSWRFFNLHHLQEQLQCYSINVTESKLSLCGTPTNYRHTGDMCVYIHTHVQFQVARNSLEFKISHRLEKDNEIDDPVYWLIISFHFDSFRLFGWKLSCIYTS